MQDRGADLVDGGIPAEVLEGSTTTAKTVRLPQCGGDARR